MKLRPFALVASLALAALSVVACVELTGQRISWFHDVAKDELRFLICYDGIHEGSHDPAGTEQLPEFVANGDVMLLDWPFHIDRKELGERVTKADALPEERAFLERLLAMRTEAVGWYVEPNNRIGALQRVIVPQVSRVIAAANDLINAEIVADEGDGDAEWPRTVELCRDAAKQGHQWIALDGQQFVFTVPVQRDEWERGKRAVVDSLIRGLVGSGGDEVADMHRALDAIARMPVSLIDDGDHVTVLLGLPKSPGIARAEVRDEYSTALESLVKEQVKAPLLASLGEAAIRGAPADSALADLIAWGAPELTALALVERIDRIRAANPGVDADVTRERAALTRFVTEWNDAGRLPPAPEGDQRREWLEWYAAVAGH